MRRLAAVAVLALAVAGCAETRMAGVGPLPDRHRLVTLVVTTDRGIVERECRGVPSAGPIFGCEISTPLALPEGGEARTIKIVRLTDSLPSVMAFEIEAHELCHAVASLQKMDDPCHLENGGVLHADLTPRAALPFR